MHNLKSKSIVGGFLIALIIIRFFYMFTSPISYQLFALFLGYTACVYFGAALSDSRSFWLNVELVMSLLFFSFASLGLLQSPIWLGIGYIIHGLWDMLHHPKLVKTKIIKWFPPLCAVVDVIIAAFILIFY